MQALRNYVLVHGGNCTGAIWSRMTPHLNGRALAVDLPGRNDEAGHAAASFETWSDAVTQGGAYPFTHSELLENIKLFEAIVASGKRGGETVVVQGEPVSA